MKIGNNCILKLNQHTESVKSVCYSNDEKYIISSSKDTNIKIFSVEKNETIKIINNLDKILCLAVNNIVNLLASGGRDKTIRSKLNI